MQKVDEVMLRILEKVEDLLKRIAKEMPSKLVEIFITMGCPERGVVLDPFGGAGTTALVASKLLRKWIIIEANPEYAKLAQEQLKNQERRLF